MSRESHHTPRNLQPVYNLATNRRARRSYHRNMPVIADRLTDEELMLEIRSATERAFADALFNQVSERYHGRVVAWCYRITRSRETAYDLGQEVFLKAWKHRDSFRGDSRLSTWLYAITRNHCLTAMKKRRNDP